MHLGPRIDQGPETELERLCKELVELRERLITEFRYEKYEKLCRIEGKAGEHLRDIFHEDTSKVVKRIRLIEDMLGLEEGEETGLEEEK